MQRTFRPDDGTTQWLDEMAMNRIRKRQNQQPLPQTPQRQQIMLPEQNQNRKVPHPVLDRKVNTAATNAQIQQMNVLKFLPGDTPETIQKAKNYAEKTYMRMPHVVSPLYAPGAKFLKERGADAVSLRNLSERVSINTDVDNLSGKIQSVILGKFGAGDSQDQIYAQMNPNMRIQVAQKMQDLEKGKWVAPNTLLPQSQNNNNFKNCKIITGFPVFQQIQTQGFGSAIPLVRALGQISPQMSGIDFVIREVVKAYIVHPNETTINLAAIQTNQQNLTELVVLQAPPMTGMGIVLVPKEAIANGMGGGHQILTDARQRTLGQHQQYMHQKPQMTLPNQYKQQQPQQMVYAHNQPNLNGRGILRG